MLVLRSSLSVQDVYNNLRARGRQWRLSSVPAELTRIGVTGLSVIEQRNEFLVQWIRKSSGFNDPLCHVTVARTQDAGSETSLRFTRSRLVVIMGPTLFVIAELGSTVTGGAGNWFRWALVAVMAGAVTSYFLGGRSHREILQSHLIKVVEDATRQAESERDIWRPMPTNGP